MADYISEYSGQQIDERLGLAGTAYQKPAEGIPAEDIAPGVIPTDVVKFSEQELTDSQKEQARENIGAYAKPADGIPETDLEPGIIPQDVLQYSSQELSEAQQEQARANIGAYHKPTTGIPAEDLATGVIPGIMTGAGESTPGASGIVPAPAAGDNVKFLRGDGTWQTVGGGNNGIFVATYGTTTYAEINTAVSAGKIVVCFYNTTRMFVLAGLHASSYVFVEVTGSTIYSISVTSASVWSYTGEGWQKASNLVKSTDGWSFTPSDSKYPSEKLVYDTIGQKGVISQTITWTGDNANGYEASVSSPVPGLIPQSFIDLVTALGANFNQVTGYFELNGIDNIAYDEMREIYARKTGECQSEIGSIYPVSYNARTCFPIFRGFGVSYPNHSTTTIKVKYAFGGKYGLNTHNSNLVIIALTDDSVVLFGGAADDFANNCDNNKTLKEIRGRINVQNGGLFFYQGASCPKLETFSMSGLKNNINLSGMPSLKPATIAYMINNAGTTTITITLHPTAYAAAIADADVTAALTAHSNVTLASA